MSRRAPQCNLVHLALTVCALSACRRSADAVTDIDHNSYPTVTVGNQQWLAANLHATRSPTGHPLVTYLPNGDSTLVATFGLLYDWPTAQAACMAGWHLPTDEEWALLAEHLRPTPGGALKDTSQWLPPNIGAANAFGFGARPAGYWNDAGFDNLFGHIAVYWSATTQDTQFVWSRVLASAHDSLRRVGQHPEYGLSVRCVKNP